MADDIATFGVVIDPSKAKKGGDVVESSLKSIEKTSRRTQRTISRGFDGLRRSLLRAFSGIALVLAIRSATRLADAYTNVQNRLKLVTKGTDDLRSVTAELFAISNRTRSSYEATAELYSRVALSAEHLGRAQGEILDFTETINKAIILSGAAPEEAAGALRQLSQGIAANRLSGQELNSVLEQTPLIAKIIAEELGVATGRLRILGEQGKITADVVFNAFNRAKEGLDKEFQDTVATIGQSFQVLRNNIIRAIGEFDEATGTSRTFSRVILLIAKNLNTLRESFGDENTGIGRFVKNVRESVSELNVAIGFLENGRLGKALQVVGLTLADKIIGWNRILSTWLLDLTVFAAKNLSAAIVAGISAGINLAIQNVKAENAGGLIGSLFAGLPDDVTISFERALEAADKVFGDIDVENNPINKMLESGQSAMVERLKQLREELEAIKEANALNEVVEAATELDNLAVSGKLNFFEKLSGSMKAFFGDFRTGFKEFSDQLGDGTSKAADLGASTADILTGSFQDFFESIGTGIRSSKDLFEGFKSLALSILDQVANELIRIFIVNQIVKGISGFFGGLFNGGAAAAGNGAANATTSVAAVQAHTGGVIGADSLKGRFVNHMAVKGAQIMHGGGIAGLRSNEQLTVLEKGEGVFTQGQMKALGNLNSNVKVEVYNLIEPVDAKKVIGSRDGVKAVLNTISLNPGAVNSAISGGS